MATTRPARPLPAASAPSTSCLVAVPASAIVPAPRRPAVAPVVAPLAVARSITPSAAGTASVHARAVAVLRAGLREYRSHRALWVLLVGVPAVLTGWASPRTDPQTARVH